MAADVEDYLDQEEIEQRLEEYDDPLDLLDELVDQVDGTELSSPGWSIFKGEFLNDLAALQRMIERVPAPGSCPHCGESIKLVKLMVLTERFEKTIDGTEYANDQPVWAVPTREQAEDMIEEGVADEYRQVPLTYPGGGL